MNVHYNPNQSSQFVKKQKRKLLYLAAYGVDYSKRNAKNMGSWFSLQITCEVNCLWSYWNIVILLFYIRQWELRHNNDKEDEGDIVWVFIIPLLNKVKFISTYY